MNINLGDTQTVELPTIREGLEYKLYCAVRPVCPSAGMNILRIAIESLDDDDIFTLIDRVNGTSADIKNACLYVIARYCVLFDHSFLNEEMWQVTQAWWNKYHT